MNTNQADPLEWLLEEDPLNPGVRAQALRHLAGCPEDDPQLRRAQADVMASGPIPAILAAQHPEGYWVKSGSGYSPKYRGTVWQMIFLAELGADPQDGRVRRGCEYLFNNGLAVNGAFSAYVKPVPSGAIHCLNGNLLYALQMLGYEKDPRVLNALQWQAQSITGEGGFSYLRSAVTGPLFGCSANLSAPCAWGAVKAMKAFSAIAPERRSPAVQRAVQSGADFLLSRDPAQADYPYTGNVSSTWFKLGFPLSYWSDVLEVVAVLSDLGYGRDPRLENAVQFVLSKRDGQGRWKLENSLNGKTWADIETKGKPSKWVTLRALRALKSQAGQVATS